MDKLQPIIKHRFWILLGLVVPIALFGYFSANGAIKEATAKRTAELDTAYSSVPTGNEVNPTYPKQAKLINEELGKKVDAQIVRIWEDQQSLLTWPAAMEKYIPETYRGEILDRKQAGFLYKDEYRVEMRKLFEFAEPVVSKSEQATWTQKVVLSPLTLPQSVFGDFAITSEQMWDAQEDIWYTRLLLDAVRRVNAPADSVMQAAVRQVSRLELMGGSGVSTVQASGGGGDGGVGGMDSAEYAGMSMALSGMGGAGGQQGRGQTKVDTAFNPAEEFGPAQEGGGAGAYGSAMMDMSSLAESGGGGELGGGGATAAAPLRYIALDETAAFRERGFYMSVIINQMKIPHFLVALANSEWPVRVVRFQVGPNTYYKEPSPTGQGNPMGFPGMFAGGGAEQGFIESSPNSLAGEGGGAFGGSVNPMGNFGPMGGLGGFAGGMNRGSVTVNLQDTEYPDALNNPELVQLDLCGIITFYNPPTQELLDRVKQLAEATDAAPATTESPAAVVPSGDGAAPAEAAPAADLAEPIVAPASDGESAPVTDPAAADPTAAPADPTAAPSAEAAPAEGVPSEAIAP